MEKNLFEGISDKEIIEMLNKKIIKLTTELEELKKEWNKACDILEAFAEDKYYNEGYEQALKDVEKIGRSDSTVSIRPTDKYFIFISQKRWEKLKLKR